MTQQWPAPGKLNLFLYITGRRPDGYHDLQTLFQFLDYSDTLTIIPTHNGRIRLLTPLAGVAYKDNLIIRAAQQLQSYCWDQTDPHTPGADISLNKILPIGGGLGGGSSNAATVLVALNHEWKCGLTLDTLAYIGLALGADVPVFVLGHAAFAEGIGEQLNPANPPEKWYLVTIPPVSIATPQIFSDDEIQRTAPHRSLEQLLAIPFCNVCEVIVRKHFSVVEQHLSWLLKSAPSRLTGTGACVFAEFDTEASARQLLSLAPVWMRGFVAKGVNTSPLQHVLLEAH